MHAVKVLFRKELADHFSRYRCISLFTVISMVSLSSVYMVSLNIRENLEGVVAPRYIFLMLYTSSDAAFSLTSFVGLFGPLIGLILGFDAINRERSEGTLSKLLSQPIYRDSILNGKFLAGVTVITIIAVSVILFIAGLGLSVVGVIPSVEGVWRLAVFLVISILYVAFWLGLAMLFSILFRSVVTSALVAVAMWIFLCFFVPLGANAVAGAVTPEVGVSTSNALFKRASIESAIALTSPKQLYDDATGIIMNPMRRTNRRVSADEHHGGDITLAILRTASSKSEHLCHLALSRFAYGGYSFVFRHFLCRVYAAGNSVAVDETAYYGHKGVEKFGIVAGRRIGMLVKTRSSGWDAG